MTRPPQVPQEVLEKFILGFEGRELPAELRQHLEGGLAGVILYPRNFSCIEELHSLAEEIRRVAGRPVLIGIDQEGGTQFSLSEPFTQWVSPEQLGRIDDPELVEQQARALARELRATGCNLDFAPVLDLHLQSKSPVTNGRSYGDDPQKVARLGAAFVRGLAIEGVLACAKHFPGHGDTVIDPHHDLPTFCGSLNRLREVELVPFRRAIAAGVPLIMTAHIMLPKVDAHWPASLSEPLLRAILRTEAKFQGVILADDLGMGAIAKRCPPRDAAIQTFRAGSDLALLCRDWSLVRPALESVERALQSSRFDPREWNRSRERIARLREMVKSADQNAPSLTFVGCAEHRALSEEIQARLAETTTRP